MRGNRARIGVDFIKETSKVVPFKLLAEILVKIIKLRSFLGGQRLYLSPGAIVTAQFVNFTFESPIMVFLGPLRRKNVKLTHFTLMTFGRFEIFNVSKVEFAIFLFNVRVITEL